MRDELIEHLTDKNKNLVRELIYIIESNKLKTIDDIIRFEREQFKINDRYLNKKEIIEYASNITLASYWDYDGLELKQINMLKKLKNSLSDNIGDDEKIFNLIKIYDITGKECLFVKEAYDLIINDIY